MKACRNDGARSTVSARASASTAAVVHLTQIPKLPKATSESAASGAVESPPSEEQICSSEGGGVQPRRGASKAFAAPVSARKANSENRNLGLSPDGYKGVV